MTLIIKIIAISLVCAVAILILKQLKPEFVILVTIIGSLVISFLVLDMAFENISIFKTLIEKTGINTQLFKVVLKIIGIGYLCEFASNICMDSGINSLGDKILIAGKLLILTQVMPILMSLISTLLEIVI